MQVKQQKLRNEHLLKVVHLNASSAGGAFVAAQRLSDALSHLPGVDSQHWVFDGADGVFYRWANTWWRRKLAFALHALEKLHFLRFEKDKSVRFAFSHGLTGINVSQWKAVAEADIIHLHWINKGFISLRGLENLLALGKRVVWTCHDMWPFTGGCYHPRGCNHFQNTCGNCQYLKQPGKGDLSAKTFDIKRRIFTESQQPLLFVTPSHWLRDQALLSGMKANVVGVIPNAIDTDYFVEQMETLGRRGAEPNLNVSDIYNASNAFVLMFAAANLGNVAKGFAEFRDLCNGLWAMGYTNIEALIVGENRLPHGNFGLDCPYRELGFISDAQKMREAYWQSDVYVTTSHEENLPTTIMESLSCGVPVAAFAVGGIPEMIDGEGEYQTGWLSAKLDILPLVNGIAHFIQSNKELRNRIRANCRKSAVANYHGVGIAKQYLRIYQS